VTGLPQLTPLRAAIIALASLALVALFGWWRYTALLEAEVARTDRGLRGTAEFMGNWTDLLLTERSRDARLLAAALADARTTPQRQEQMRRFVSDDGNTAAWLRLPNGELVSSVGAGQPDSLTLKVLGVVACTGRDTLLPQFSSKPLRVDVLLLRAIGADVQRPGQCAQALALRANLTPAVLPYLQSQARLSTTGTSYIAARLGTPDARAIVIVASRTQPPYVRLLPEWRLSPHLRAAMEGRDSAFSALDMDGTDIRGASLSFRGASWGVVRQIESRELEERIRARALTEAGLALSVLLAVMWMVLANRRALRIEQLKGDLTGVQLEVLRAQLQPHFLFNVLNSVSELIHRDPDAADAMIVRLSRLLRFSLATRMEHEIPLSEEIEGLRAYADIEQARFPDRLRVEYDIPANLHDALVPPLLLQPIVENAVKYGMAQSAGEGRIVVRAREEGGMLWLSVSDSGAGLDATRATSGFGVGLGNTRRRLSRLYGSAQRVHIRSRSEGGAHVDLELPLRRDRVAATAAASAGEPPELPVTWRLH
jgi:hypothetical protein